MNDIPTLLRDFGFPIALCLILLFAFWSVLKWAAQRIDTLLARHMQFLDVIEDNLEKLTDSQRDTLHILKDVVQSLTDVRHGLKEITVKAKEVKVVPPNKPTDNS